jgi:hypothetical protein
MGTKLSAIFEGKNLQAAADQILTDIDTPEARIAHLNKLIAGEVNPTFEQSEAIMGQEAASHDWRDPGEAVGYGHAIGSGTASSYRWHDLVTDHEQRYDCTSRR